MKNIPCVNFLHLPKVFTKSFFQKFSFQVFDMLWGGGDSMVHSTYLFWPLFLAKKDRKIRINKLSREYYDILKR